MCVNYLLMTFLFPPLLSHHYYLLLLLFPSLLFNSAHRRRQLLGAGGDPQPRLQHWVLLHGRRRLHLGLPPRAVGPSGGATSNQVRFYYNYCTSAFNWHITRTMTLVVVVGN